MSDNTHDVKVLNGLIEALIDCADGYAEAGKEAQEVAYAAWFDRRASHYLALAETLKDEVRSRGGSPEDNGSILAKATRAFTGFKQAVLGSRESVSQMIHPSEALLRSRFEKASEDDQLSVTTRDVVRRGLEQLPHDEAEFASLGADTGRS